jgi:hypothetical protein
VEHISIKFLIMFSVSICEKNNMVLHLPCQKVRLYDDCLEQDVQCLKWLAEGFDLLEISFNLGEVLFPSGNIALSEFLQLNTDIFIHSS